MRKKYFKIIILVGILLIVSASLLAFSKEEGINNEVSVKIPDKIVAEEESIEIPNKAISITLIIGEKEIEIENNPGATLYDFLNIAQERKLIVFAGRNYPALGFFVTDIENLHNNGDNNLMYYINGKEASVGVSSYKPVDGDIISWELK